MSTWCASRRQPPRRPADWSNCLSCALCRVLQPGGSFLLVSLGDPTRRLPMLCDAELAWKVSLLLLPKISAANQAYVDGK